MYKQTNLDEKALSKLSTKVPAHSILLLLTVPNPLNLLQPTCSATPPRPVWRSSWITFRPEPWKNWPKSWTKAWILISTTQTLEVGSSCWTRANRVRWQGTQLHFSTYLWLRYPALCGAAVRPPCGWHQGPGSGRSSLGFQEQRGPNGAAQSRACPQSHWPAGKDSKSSGVRDYYGLDNKHCGGW